MPLIPTPLPIPINTSGAPNPTGRDRAARRLLGIYYTPPPLVDHLLRAALAPLMPSLRRQGGRLPIVLDPAMGDGAFLAAAADRIAGAIAAPAGLPFARARARVVSRCIRGVDIDAAAVELASHRLGTRAGHGRLVRGDFLSEALRVAGPFDLIVGNPPWGGWNRSLSPEARLRLRARFETARGLIDPFALFLERCTRLLEPGGRLAMVLPDYFLLKNYPAARRLVLDNYDIEELARWGRAFPGVNLDACTLVATRRGARTPRHVIRCLPEGPEGPVVRTPQARFLRTPGHTLNLSLNARDAALFGRLETRGVALGRWLETHEGIHSGNVRAKLFVPPGRRDARLPLLVLGRDEIRPFTLRPAGWGVRYDRRVIVRAQGEYANLGNERWFASRKILVRRTGDAVVAALDSRGLFASNNLFVALPREECPVPLDYLEAYLNSSLATWCFRVMQPRQGRLFAELKLTHLNRLPVPLPRGASGLREAGRIVALARTWRRSGPGAGGALAAVLDDAFGRLAGLSPAESKRIARKIHFPPRTQSPL